MSNSVDHVYLARQREMERALGQIREVRRSELQSRRDSSRPYASHRRQHQREQDRLRSPRQVSSDRCHSSHIEHSTSPRQVRFAGVASIVSTTAQSDYDQPISSPTSLSQTRRQWSPTEAARRNAFLSQHNYSFFPQIQPTPPPPSLPPRLPPNLPLRMDPSPDSRPSSRSQRRSPTSSSIRISSSRHNYSLFPQIRSIPSPSRSPKSIRNHRHDRYGMTARERQAPSPQWDGRWRGTPRPTIVPIATGKAAEVLGLAPKRYARNPPEQIKPRRRKRDDICPMM